MDAGSIIFEFTVGGFISNETLADLNDVVRANHSKISDNSWSSLLGLADKSSSLPWNLCPSPFQIAITPDRSKYAVLLTEKLLITNGDGDILCQVAHLNKIVKGTRKTSITWYSDSFLLINDGDGGISIITAEGHVIGTLPKRVKSSSCVAVIPRPSDSSSEEAIQFIAVYSTAEAVTWQVGLDGLFREVHSVLLSQKLSYVMAAHHCHKWHRLLVLSADNGSPRTDCTLTIYELTSRTVLERPLSSCDIQLGHYVASSTTGEENDSGLLGTVSPYFSRFLSSRIRIPVKQLEASPDDRLMVLLHADGVVTVIKGSVITGSNSEFAVLSERTTLPWHLCIGHSRSSSSSKPITHRVYFLSNSILSAVTVAGEVGVFHVSDTNGQITCAAVDALPPALGPCSCIRTLSQSDSGIGDSSAVEAEGSKLVLLRSVDAWTAQIFAMTVISPRRALLAKLSEGLFSSARELADRLGVDADVVILAEWSHLCGQRRVTLKDVEILDRVQDVDAALRAAAEYADDDEVVWTAVLQSGFRRTQPTVDDLTAALQDIGTGSVEVALKQGLITAEQGTRLAYRRLFRDRMTRVRVWRCLQKLDDKALLLTETEDLCAAKKSLTTLVLQSEVAAVALDVARLGDLVLLRELVELGPRQLVPRLLDLLGTIPVFLDWVQPTWRDAFLELLPLAGESSQSVASVKVLRNDVACPLLSPSDVLAAEFGDNVAIEEKVLAALQPTLPADLAWPARSQVPGSSRLDVSRVSLSKWFVSQSLRFEGLGQVDAAHWLAVAGLRRCSSADTEIGAGDSPFLFLTELEVQLSHFRRLLYDCFIHPNTSLREWVRAPLSARVTEMLRSDRFLSMLDTERETTQPGSESSATVSFLQSHVKPLVDGDRRLHATLSPKEFASALDSFSDPDAEYLVLPEPLEWPQTALAWEGALVASLVDLCSQGSSPDLRDVALRQAVEVAEASLPTLQRADRCVTEVACLVSLVTRSCYAYDRLTSVSIAFMWRLIESTPTVLPEGGAGQANEGLARALDKVQESLSAGELIRPWIDCPPLSVLRPETAADRLHRRQTVRKLVQGKGGLAASVTQLMALVDEGNASAKPSEDEQQDELAQSYRLQRFDLEQAIVLAMCHNLGERKAAMTAFTPKCDVVIDVLWEKLAADLAELCGTFFPSLSRLWTGCAVLIAMLHFGATRAFSRAVELLRNPSEGAARDGKGNGFVRLGLTLVHADSAALMKARDLFNSLGSCSDSLRSQAVGLLDIVTATASLEDSASMSLRSALTAERALHELTGWLAKLDVDFVPLRLRLAPLDEFVSDVLRQRPDALSYFVDEGFEQTDGAEDGPGMLMRGDVLPPRGSLHLVRLLKAVALGGGATESGVMWHESNVWMALVKGALSQRNLQSSFLFSRQLIAVAETEALSAGMKTRIDDCLHSVGHALEKQAASSDPLAVAMFSSFASMLLTSKDEVDLDLWRRAKTPGSLQSDPPRTEISLTNGRQSACLIAAREAMIQVIGSCLVNPGDPTWIHQPLLTSAEVVSGVGARNRLSDAVGNLLVAGQSDAAAVQSMLAQLSKDLERKLSGAKAVSSQPRAAAFGSLALDEDLAGQVEALGFSRNGARRAVFFTKGVGLEQALRWAVEHSNDPDFEEPIAVSASGCLLPSDLRGDVDGQSLRLALQAIESVANTYACMSTVLEGDKSVAAGAEATLGLKYPTGSKEKDAVAVTVPSQASDGAPEAGSVCEKTEQEAVSHEPSEDKYPYDKFHTSDGNDQSLPVAAIQDIVEPPPAASDSLQSQLARASSVAALEAALSSAMTSLEISGSLTGLARGLVLLEGSSDEAGVVQQAGELLEVLLLQGRGGDDLILNTALSPLLELIPAHAGLRIQQWLVRRLKDWVEGGAGCDGTYDTKRVLWLLAARKFTSTLATADSDADQSCARCLIADPIGFTSLLTTCYDRTSGTEIATLATLKRLGGEALAAYGQEGGPVSAISKQLQEEAACLRRIQRLDSSMRQESSDAAACLKLDAKVLIMAARLLPAEGSQDRNAALAELRKFLRPNPASQLQAWHRAVGRLLNVSTSELQLLCAVETVSRTDIGTTLADLELELSPQLAKLTPVLQLSFCRAVSGFANYGEIAALPLSLTIDCAVRDSAIGVLLSLLTTKGGSAAATTISSRVLRPRPTASRLGSTGSADKTDSSEPDQSLGINLTAQVTYYRSACSLRSLLPTHLRAMVPVPGDANLDKRRLKLLTAELLIDTDWNTTADCLPKAVLLLGDLCASELLGPTSLPADRAIDLQDSFQLAVSFILEAVAAGVSAAAAKSRTLTLMKNAEALGQSQTIICLLVTNLLEGLVKLTEAADIAEIKIARTVAAECVGYTDRCSPALRLSDSALLCFRVLRTRQLIHTHFLTTPRCSVPAVRTRGTSPDLPLDVGRGPMTIPDALASLLDSIIMHSEGGATATTALLETATCMATLLSIWGGGAASSGDGDGNLLKVAVSSWATIAVSGSDGQRTMEIAQWAVPQWCRVVDFLCVHEAAVAASATPILDVLALQLGVFRLGECCVGTPEFRLLTVLQDLARLLPPLAGLQLRLLLGGSTGIAAVQELEQLPQIDPLTASLVVCALPASVWARSPLLAPLTCAISSATNARLLSAPQKSTGSIPPLSLSQLFAANESQQLLPCVGSDWFLAYRLGRGGFWLEAGRILWEANRRPAAMYSAAAAVSEIRRLLAGKAGMRLWQRLPETHDGEWGWIALQGE